LLLLLLSSIASHRIAFLSLQIDQIDFPPTVFSLVLQLQNKQDRQTDKPTVSWQTPSSSLLQHFFAYLPFLLVRDWNSLKQNSSLSLSLSL
jgi:hypothetical protein